MFRLRAGERSRRYTPGQFVSADYAARYPHKVRAVRKRHAPPLPPPPVEPEAEEYEITVEYGER